jgi:hypothetical protein
MQSNITKVSVKELTFGAIKMINDTNSTDNALKSLDIVVQLIKVQEVQLDPEKKDAKSGQIKLK